MNSFLKYFFFVFALLAFGDVIGQTDNPKQEYLNSTINERKFDEGKWKDLVKGFDYSEKPAKKSKPKETGSEQTAPTSSSFNSPFLANIIQILFIVVVAGAVIFLLIYMLGSGKLFAPRNRNVSRSDNFSIENIEENFHESDLEKFIREAVEQGKYALAIRLYYLAIIKELSLSKMIKWKRDKTNRSYLSEIRSTNLFSPFNEVTRIFERVWYGEGKLEEQEYLSIKPKFEQLIKATQATAAATKTD